MKSIVGIGLLALDVVLEKDSKIKPLLYAGGSCGNLMCILSYLGFSTYPIARLAENKATEELLSDFNMWGVKTDLISKSNDGSTPIIIQRLSKSKEGLPIHRFEFRNPEDGKYLPSFKPVLANTVDVFFDKKSICDFFFLDRISRSSIELAKLYKDNGAIVIFEPSSLKIENKKLLDELVEFVDILKFSNDRIPLFKTVFQDGIFPIEIETLGKSGINYRINNNIDIKNNWKHIPSFELGNVIDTAGAGDWTTAGLIKGLIDNNVKSISEINVINIDKIFKYAQSLGALSCLFKGARGMMYQIDEHFLHQLSKEVIENNFNENKLIANFHLKERENFDDSISSLF